MQVNKIALFLMLLTFLSGTFTLGRLNIGFNIEVRYLLLAVFLLVVLMGLKKEEKLSERLLNKDIILFSLTILLYSFMSTLSLFYIGTKITSLDKYMSLLFLILLIIGYMFVVKSMKPRIFFDSITLFFVVIGIVYAVPVFFSVLSGAHRGDVLLSGPNVTTRILFFATCASYYKYYISKNSLYFLFSLFFLACIILVGSRGGLVGATIIITLLLVIKRKQGQSKKKKNNKLSIKKIFLIPIVIGILYLIYEPVKNVFISRIIGDTFSGGGVYTSGRNIIYADAIKMIRERPFRGHGIDSFTLYTGHVYPHNLILEMMVEIGLIGALIFLLFLVYSIIPIFKLRKSPLFILSVIPLYMIIVQMFSGEFYDFRYYFLWNIPLLYYGFVDKRQLKSLEPTEQKHIKSKKWARTSKARIYANNNSTEKRIVSSVYLTNKN